MSRPRENTPTEGGPIMVTEQQVPDFTSLPAVRRARAAHALSALASDLSESLGSRECVLRAIRYVAGLEAEGDTGRSPYSSGELAELLESWERGRHLSADALMALKAYFRVTLRGRYEAGL